MTLDPDSLDFQKGHGLIPVVVQDHATLQVLTLAYMDRAALDETIQSGEATFFSRSRGGRWRKGETSGNRLKVVSITPDCDADALVLAVQSLGPACHLGTTSCFGDADAPGLGALAACARFGARGRAGGAARPGALADGAFELRPCRTSLQRERVHHRGHSVVTTDTTDTETMTDPRPPSSLR